MAEEIGEAVVRITGDIKPLQDQIKKVKSEANSLQNFKVNVDGEFSGNIEEYNKYYENAVSEAEKLNTVNHELTSSLDNVSKSVQSTAESMNVLSSSNQKNIEKTSRLKDTLSTIGDIVRHPIQSAEGSFRRLGDSLEDAGRRGRTILIALSTALVAFGKTSLDEYAKYNKEFASTQEETSKSFSKLKASIGQLLSPIYNTISGIANWLSENQKLVAGVLTTIGVIAGGAGLIAVVIKLKTAITALGVATSGVLGVLGLIAGVITSIVAPQTDFLQTTEELEKEQKKQEETTKKLNDAYSTYSKTMSEVEEELANIRKEQEKTTKEFRQNLKQILVSHEKTVDTLTQQIKDANADYQKAIDERNVSFAVSQAEEEREHQDKVDALMQQINFLQRYNNKYNQEKLSQLQFALEKENNLYKKQTEAEKKELDLQNENDRLKNEAKIQEYKNELNEELALLNKHRDLLNSVRNEILDDEVENLYKQYREQMTSYDLQIRKAREKGQEAGNAYASAYAEMAKDTIKSTSERIQLEIQQSLVKGFESTEKFIKDKGYEKKGWRIGQLPSGETAIINIAPPDGYADGGFTGRGGVNEVAGVVHKGEYVLPQEQVDQTTGKPKLNGVNVNITMNGAFATSDVERRRFAEEIRYELNKIDFARLGA